MVVAPLSNAYSREIVMDFVNVPFFIEHNGFLYRRPRSYDEMFYMFLKPFKGKVWLALFGSIPLSGFFVWILMVLSVKQQHPVCPKPQHSLWFTFGALFAQSKQLMLCNCP